MSDVLILFLCLVLSITLSFLTMYILLLIGDIECDYSNTKTGCGRLNYWVLPEMVLCVILSLLLVFTYHWILFLFTLPTAAYVAYKYFTIPPGNIGLYDPTIIRNRGMISTYQREAFVKIGYHIIASLVILYSFIAAIIF